MACAADSLPFVDLGAVGTVSPVDGIHYDLVSSAAQRFAFPIAISQSLTLARVSYAKKSCTLPYPALFCGQASQAAIAEAIGGAIRTALLD